MNNEIAVQQIALPNVFESNTLEKLTAIANLMSSGKSTVPAHLQGKPADCTAICMQAYQWGMNPFAVAQKTHLVSGTLGYEAQLVNAVISSSTAIEGRFHYKYGGEWISDKDETAWIKVGAILKGEKEIQWGEPLYPCKVTTKNSPLWKTAPKQQSAYLAVKYWARLYCPAVILGVYTSDEIQDIPGKVTPMESVIEREEPKEVAGERVEDEKPATEAEPEQEQEQEKDPEITLQFVLDEIEKTKTVEELEAIQHLAGNFESQSDDWKIAAKSWKSRRAELLRASDKKKTKPKAEEKPDVKKIVKKVIPEGGSLE